VLADPEAEPASPRPADEMGALDSELVEDSYGVGDAERDPVRLGGVRLLATAVPAMIDVDPAELRCRQRLGDPPLTQVFDGVREAVVKDNRRTISSLILEIDSGSVLPVRGM
jgi:hypothetical protein